MGHGTRGGLLQRQRGPARDKSIHNNPFEQSEDGSMESA